MTLKKAFKTVFGAFAAATSVNAVVLSIPLSSTVQIGTFIATTALFLATCAAVDTLLQRTH